jgi:hypothetical protein
MAFQEIFKHEYHIRKMNVLSKNNYLSVISDFVWEHSFTKLNHKRRLSAVFSTTHRVTWISKHFFDSSIDIYTYNLSGT